MNPEIEKLIEYAIADGLINNKEREIIRKKAEKLNEDPDEAEMILDAKLAMRENQTTKASSPEKKSNNKSRSVKKKTPVYSQKAEFGKKKILEDEIKKEQLQVSTLIQIVKSNGESLLSTNEKINKLKQQANNLLGIQNELKKDYVSVLTNIRQSVERILGRRVVSPKKIEELIYKADTKNLKEHFFNCTWDITELSSERKMKTLLFKASYWIVFAYWGWDLLAEKEGLLSDKPWFGISGWYVFGLAFLMACVSEFYKGKLESNLMDFTDQDLSNALNKVLNNKIINELAVLNNLQKELSNLSSNLKFKTDIDLYTKEVFFHTNASQLHLIK